MLIIATLVIVGYFFVSEVKRGFQEGLQPPDDPPDDPPSVPAKRGKKDDPPDDPSVPAKRGKKDDPSVRMTREVKHEWKIKHEAAESLALEMLQLPDVPDFEKGGPPAPPNSPATSGSPGDDPPLLETSTVDEQRLEQRLADDHLEQMRLKGFEPFVPILGSKKRLWKKIGEFLHGSTQLYGGQIYDDKGNPLGVGQPTVDPETLEVANPEYSYPVYQVAGTDYHDPGYTVYNKSGVPLYRHVPDPSETLGHKLVFIHGALHGGGLRPLDLPYSWGAGSYIENIPFELTAAQQQALGVQVMYKTRKGVVTYDKYQRKVGSNISL